ncbi:MULTISPECIES: Hsp20/alpha crystallin family protein [unclassified Jeotgalibaca]|uniref:Hsp20/alpha crystallin family protein n=1 Tax=unclassified Jeotgalibaca TaxID=2621505 RepID=UPI003FD5F3B2
MSNWFPSRRNLWDLGKSNFDDAFDQFFRNNEGNFNTDIKELDDKYVLEADLPGLAKEDIHLDYRDNILSISAKSEMGKDETDEKGNYIRRERSMRSYSRQFLLRDVDEENVTATFKDGVLTVELPKKEPETPTTRRIDIQ